MKEFKPSISEKNGLSLLKDTDKEILSVGISTGGSAEIEMARKNRESHIIATTIDKNGLQFSKKIIEDLGLSDRIEIKLEDVAKRLPYKNERFDYIYARLVFHYLNDMQLNNSLSEIYRVLKQSGRFFIVVRSIKEWEAKLKGTTYDAETGFTTYPDITTLESENVRYISRRLHSEESIKEFLKDAGFKIEYITTYEEYLYRDYERINKNPKPNTIIEVCATK